MKNHIKTSKILTANFSKRFFVSCGWWWLIPIIILLTAMFLLLPTSNHLSKIQIEQFQSDTQLKGIAQLILSYKSKHEGNVPPNLGAIVPDDRTDLLSIFSAPNEVQSQRPVGWSTNKAILDEWSDYVLSPQLNSGIVAFERNGLWPDETVAICFTNLSVERMDASKLKSLLNGDDNSALMR